MEKTSYVYMLASALNGTLYVGVTSDLLKRVWQHKEGLADGFTKRYAVKKLVWYEIHADVVEAIRREKQIKKWERRWKVELIEQTNPHWCDLYADIVASVGGLGSRFRGNDGSLISRTVIATARKTH